MIDAERLRQRRAWWRERVGRTGKVSRWQPAEHAVAVEMRARGKTCGQIALKVKRTPDAVRARLRDYGSQEEAGQ